ncbi:unnamed protein product [Prunus brigantina]
MRLFFFFVKIWFCFVDCTAVARSFLQVAATEEVASPLRVVQIEGISMILLIIAMDTTRPGHLDPPRPPRRLLDPPRPPRSRLDPSRPPRRCLAQPNSLASVSSRLVPWPIFRTLLETWNGLALCPRRS